MIILFCGKYGSGKGAMLERTVHTVFNTSTITLVAPYATQILKPYEADDTPYRYLSRPEFEEYMKLGLIFAPREYNTTLNNKYTTYLYGFPNITSIDNPFHHYAAAVDTQTAKAFIDRYGTENCYVIMIDTDNKIRKDKIDKYGEEGEAEWNNRLETDAANFSCANVNRIVNASVKDNGNHDTAFEEVERTINTVIKYPVDNEHINMYGTELSADQFDNVSADGIKRLIDKIPVLADELKANHPISMLDRKELLNAVAASGCIKRYIDRNVSPSIFETNCITAIIAVAMNTVTNTITRVFYNRSTDKILLVKNGDSGCNNNVLMENAINAWISFMYGDTPYDKIKYKNFSAKIEFI